MVKIWVDQSVEHSHEFHFHAFCRAGWTLPYVVRGRNRAGSGHMGSRVSTKAVPQRHRAAAQDPYHVALRAPHAMRTRMVSRTWAALAALSVLCQTVHAQIEDPASLVNMFVGTTNGGHVFPGESALLEH